MVTMGTNYLLLLCAFFAASRYCSAETRWCSVTGKAQSDRLLYPPIARLANVTGVVISRAIYSPSGSVASLETLSGPRLLATSANQQMKSWTFQTDAKGTEPCQSLIVMSFVLGDTDSLEPRENVPLSIYRISVRAYHIVLSDPAFTISKPKWSWRRRLRNK
jgi:hypothetical protein